MPAADDRIHREAGRLRQGRIALGAVHRSILAQAARFQQLPESHGSGHLPCPERRLGQLLVASTRGSSAELSHDRIFWPSTFGQLASEHQQGRFILGMHLSRLVFAVESAIIQPLDTNRGRQMRVMLLLALLLVSGAGAATTVSLGDQELTIPDYEGFTKIGLGTPAWAEWAETAAPEGRLALLVINEGLAGRPGAAPVTINVAANPHFTTSPMTGELFSDYRAIYKQRVERERSLAAADPSLKIVEGLTFDDERTVGHTQCQSHPAGESAEPVQVCRTSTSLWVGERLLHVTVVAHGPWAQLNASVVAGGYVGTLRAANAGAISSGERGD